MNGRSISETKLLIVEGRDEEMFFRAMLGDHLGKEGVQVMGIGGKTNLSPNLKTLEQDPRFPDLECVAIVRDADDNPSGAWDSVVASIQKVALEIPPDHATFSSGTPRTGVFIMPDGESEGMLETLCLNAVRGFPEFECVENYFECLDGHGVTPSNLDKARALAFLTSRSKPDRRVGEAAQAGYWPWDAPAFEKIIDFVNQM